MPNEAIKVLGSGIERLGPLPSLVLKAIDVEISQGHFDAALSRIEAMQATAQRPEPWMARRAEVLEKAGRMVDARAAWKGLLGQIANLSGPLRRANAMVQLAEQAQRALGEAN